MITCISYFKGHPHQITSPLGYWKAGIEASVGEQKCITIKRFACFYERYNFKVFESNVAIQKGEFYSELIRLLLLCIFYRHSSLGFDVSEM